MVATQRSTSVATQRLSPATLASPFLPEQPPAAFFAYMKKRDAVRVVKARGGPPWSDDPILNQYKFTNVKREHDRTTAWMRENFTNVHAPAASAGETVFNCALFRLFGTTALASLAGWTTSAYDAEALERVAHACRAEHGHAFTPAYCLPFHNSEVSGAASAQRAYERVCRRYLQGVWDRREQLSEACKTGSWRVLNEELRRIPGFGGSGFMAKEVALPALHAPRLRCDSPRT